MDRRRTPLISLLAWLPLAAALALAAGSARMAAFVLLLGLGGHVVSPVAELRVAPVAARVRRVRRARAPDAPEHCRVP
jgi:hypothetical protein